MDNITHIVLGAALGEAVAGQRLGKKAMLWGAIAANIPDVDVFFAPFQSVPNSLLSHRGFTHSILFCLAGTLLFSWLMQRWKRSGSNDFMLWVAVFSTGLFSHILLDACTTYGTGWYEPFSHRRVAFNNIFVADPFFTLPMLVSFIALLIMRKAIGARKWWNTIGFGISIAYLVFTFFNKLNVERVVQRNLLDKRIHPVDYMTTPTPLNNFLWYIVANDADGFYIGYYSIFDKHKTIDFQYYPKNRNLLIPYLEDEGVRKLVRFSEGYYCVTSDDSLNVNFHDLRFGQTGGWNKSTADFIFSYHLGHDENNAMVIQRGRINIAGKDAIHALIQRIKGV